MTCHSRLQGQGVTWTLYLELLPQGLQGIKNRALKV